MQVKDQPNVASSAAAPKPEEKRFKSEAQVHLERSLSGSAASPASTKAPGSSPKPAPVHQHSLPASTGEQQQKPLVAKAPPIPLSLIKEPKTQAEPKSNDESLPGK